MRYYITVELQYWDQIGISYIRLYKIGEGIRPRKEKSGANYFIRRIISELDWEAGRDQVLRQPLAMGITEVCMCCMFEWWWWGGGPLNLAAL